MGMVQSRHSARYPQIPDDFGFLGHKGIFGKHTKNYGKIHRFFNGKTHFVDWAIFNSYVKLPEGMYWNSDIGAVMTSCPSREPGTYYINTHFPCFNLHQRIILYEKGHHHAPSIGEPVFFHTLTWIRWRCCFHLSQCTMSFGIFWRRKAWDYHRHLGACTLQNTSKIEDAHGFVPFIG